MRGALALLAVLAVIFSPNFAAGSPIRSAVTPAGAVQWGADYVVVVTWFNYDIDWLRHFPPQVKVRKEESLTSARASSQ